MIDEGDNFPLSVAIIALKKKSVILQMDILHTHTHTHTHTSVFIEYTHVPKESHENSKIQLTSGLRFVYCKRKRKKN